MECRFILEAITTQTQPNTHLVSTEVGSIYHFLAYYIYSMV